MHSVPLSFVILVHITASNFLAPDCFAALPTTLGSLVFSTLDFVLFLLVFLKCNCVTQEVCLYFIFHDGLKFQLVKVAVTSLPVLLLVTGFEFESFLGSRE